MRRIQKEWMRLIAVDEIDRVLRVLRRELRLVIIVDQRVDDFVPSINGNSG